MRYRFGTFELDTETFELRRAGAGIHVEPLIFDLLRFLVEHPGKVLSRNAIVDAVWEGRIVSDSTISGAIKSARKALADDARLIKTVRGRGFQFIGEVTPDKDAQAPLATVTGEPGASAPQHPVASRPSIAVLPLHVLTPDASNLGLGDAVSQEVILELSRLHWMFVTARGSSFQFRDPSTDLASISSILGVRYILAGTIAIHSGQVTVAVELSIGRSGEIVWAERFEMPLEQLLQLRSTIAANIVAVVETRIHAKEALEASRLPTEDLDAWSAYHRGLWSMYRFTQSDNEEAARLFHRAIAVDPGFARAYAGLSFTHFQNAFLDYSVDRAGNRDLARRYAEKSLELDPLDPFCNLTMGRSSWLEGDLFSAMPWLERSIDLSPNYAFALYNRSLLSVLRGDGMEGETGATKALALSPIDPLGYAMLGTRAMSHMVQGEYEEAVEWVDKAIAAPNAHVHIHVIAALGHELAGYHERAAKCVATIRRLNAKFDQDDFFRAFPFEDAGFLAAAKEALARHGL